MNTFRSLLLPSLLLLVAMFNLTLVVAGLEDFVIDELGGSVRDASLFFSIEMLAYIVFAPVWGLVSDRIGRRRLMIGFGFFASGLMYLLLARATSVGELLILRFFQGSFAVMGWSTLMALVIDLPDEAKRGRNMGLMGGALIFGVSLGAPIGGAISSVFGVRAPLWTAAVLFLLLGLLAPLLLDPNQRSNSQRFKEMLGTLSRQPRLLLPYLFYFVDRYTVGFFVVLFPLYLGTLGVEDPALRGQYLAAFLLPFALLQFVSGKLTDRFGPFRPLIFGSLLYGIVLCVVGYSQLFALWWVMVALGVLASVMLPPAMALTAQLSPPGTRGSAMGGFNVAGSLGFAIGPLVGTWALARGGFGLVFVLGGVLEILAALVALAWLLRLRSKRGPQAGVGP